MAGGWRALQGDCEQLQSSFARCPASEFAEDGESPGQSHQSGAAGSDASESVLASRWSHDYEHGSDRLPATGESNRHYYRALTGWVTAIPLRFVHQRRWTKNSTCH